MTWRIGSLPRVKPSDSSSDCGAEPESIPRARHGDEQAASLQLRPLPIDVLALIDTARPDGTVMVRTSHGLTLRGRLTNPEARRVAGDSVVVATRPERLEVASADRATPPTAGTTQISGRVQQGTYLVTRPNIV